MLWMTSVMIKPILVLLIAACLSNKAEELDSVSQMPESPSTESTNRNSLRYPTTATRVEWFSLGKVWVPCAMQSGDLIWGAQIAILGYTLALLAFVVEWFLRRAQFA